VKIPVPLQPLLTTPQREISSLLKQLKIGQVLPARVLAELAPDLVRLRIATSELLARTPLPLKTGTRLKLEVISQRPIPELRILREHPKTAAEQRVRAIRTAVARQLPPSEVRRILAEVRSSTAEMRHTTSDVRGHTDPGKPVEAVRRFESILRDTEIKPAQLTPKQLKRAVMLSGVFHEARLPRGGAPETNDLKLRLLQLLAVLTGDRARLPDASQTPRPRNAGDTRPPPEGQAPPNPRAKAGDTLLNRLIRLIEGSVARIQLQQSAALPVEDSPRQAWQLDLPIQLQEGTNDVKLRIERDADSGGRGGGSGWSVNLAFQFDTIGTLQCRIGLSDERVATTFWCETPATHARVEERLPVLRQALEAQGLEVVHLTGMVGESGVPLIHIPMPDSLLDERA
jgi:hypothetical protein